MQKQTVHLPKKPLPKKVPHGTKQCAVVIPTRKPAKVSVEDLYVSTSPPTDLAAVKVRRTKHKNRRRSAESADSTSGVSTADSKDIDTNNNENDQDNKDNNVETVTATDNDNLSLAPDAYYDSHYESCSVLSFPVVPIPNAVVAKAYKKRKRERRRVKRRSKKDSCDESSEINCAVDNLSIVRREDKIDLNVEENKFANLSFLTCQSKENVDHCTCDRNVEIMKDELSHMQRSPNSTKSDSSQDNSGNQSKKEVRNYI